MAAELQICEKKFMDGRGKKRKAKEGDKLPPNVEEQNN
jgi:hypothetical protein